MSLGKVLIGVPVHQSKDYCWEQWVRAVNALTYPLFDIALVDNSPDLRFTKRLKDFENIEAWVLPYIHKGIKPVRVIVANCQNILRKMAIENRYDYLLMLEQDNLPPPDTIDYLINCNKQVVGLPYWKYEPTQKLNYMVWTELYRDKNGNLEAMITPVMEVLKRFTGELQPVFNIGFGCLLIRADVLNKFEFRVEKNESAHSDTYFGLDMFRAGINIYASTEKICDHYDTGYQKSELTATGKKMLKEVQKAVKKAPSSSKKLFLRKLRYRCKNQRL